MIEAKGLSRSFGGREVVHDVDFRVGPGEVVGFLGPNGAGKTTTIRMLLGLLRPDRGSADVSRPVGYLPEQFAGYDGMSVRGYLRFMARMKQPPSNEVDAAMARAGVADLARRPLARLSKGQRQRVGLAQALLGSPPAFVLDEPMQGLDPKQVVDARHVVQSLAHEGGAAVLLSTHVLAEAAAICDRVVVIVKGRVVAEERPGDAADLEARFLRLVGQAELA
ncbi:MAG: gliding motility-associated transport system ATP-binding protein [Acidimicrobiaceae bacterium]|nr:gliding motility-associated transport system ATP-binding protein [Acidimicrobiaceae bacterium]